MRNAVNVPSAKAMRLNLSVCRWLSLKATRTPSQYFFSLPSCVTLTMLVITPTPFARCWIFLPRMCSQRSGSSCAKAKKPAGEIRCCGSMDMRFSRCGRLGSATGAERPRTYNPTPEPQYAAGRPSAAVGGAVRLLCQDSQFTWKTPARVRRQQINRTEPLQRGYADLYSHGSIYSDASGEYVRYRSLSPSTAPHPLPS
jgi:hypothetical protein